MAPTELVPVPGTVSGSGRQTHLLLPDGTSSAGMRSAIYAGARWLIAQGWTPDTVVVFRHAGSSTIATRPRSLDWFAQWAVKGGDKAPIRRRRFQARPYEPGTAPG